MSGPPFRSGDPSKPSPLSDDTVAGAVGTLIDQRRSLATGLAALSADAPTRRMRSALRHLARRVESGVALEEAIADREVGLPRSFAVAAEAGARANRLIPVINEYQFAAAELRRRRTALWAALLYPLVVFLFGITLLTFLLTWIVPQYRGMFQDFGVPINPLTMLVITLSDLLTSPAILVAVAVVVVAGLSLLAAQRFLAPLARAFHWIPLVGAAFYWSGLSEFCRWLALFVRARTPLVPALRAMGGLIQDPWVASCCRRLARQVEDGEPLPRAVDNIAGLPAPLRSVCRWAERGEGFTDLLDSSSKIFAEQAELAARLLRLILIPLLFVGIVGMTVLVLFSMMLPLFRLLSALA